MTAIYSSSFAQQAQTLYASLQGQMNWSGGDATANSIDSLLDSFGALSASDQQTYVGMAGLQAQLTSGTTPIASAADLTANLQAQADVQRAIQVAVDSPGYSAVLEAGTGKGVNSEAQELGPLAQAAGDQQTAALVQLARARDINSTAWTQQAQAYFAQYGAAPTQSSTTTTSTPSPPPFNTPASYTPPSGQALAADLAALNDTSGKTSTADQAAAYQEVDNYIRYTSDVGPARTAFAKALQKAPVESQVASLQDNMNAGLMSSPDAYGTMAQRLAGMSSDDQQLYLASVNTDDDGGTRFASVTSLQSNYQTQSAVIKLWNGLINSYNVEAVSDITDPNLKGSKALSELEGLFSSGDWLSDGWTQQAQTALADFAKLPTGESTATQASSGAASSALTQLKAIAAGGADTSSSGVGLTVLRNAATAQQSAAAGGAWADLSAQPGLPAIQRDLNLVV